jgi:predicted metal-binding membrane protein
MLALGTVMAVEKNVAWGEQISRPLGMSLMVGAAVTALAGALGAL